MFAYCFAASLLGLDTLARERRQEKEISFRREGRAADRHYRDRLIETPTYTGGVKEDFERRKASQNRGIEVKNERCRRDDRSRSRDERNR